MNLHFRVQQGLWWLLLFLSSTAISQSKGGRWQFENHGLDTAAWDALEDNGTLQNQASLSEVAPLQEGGAYLWLDSANVHDFFLIEDSDDLDFDNENIGISAWIYPVHFERVHFIITKGDQLPIPKTTNYSLRISESKKLEFLIRDARDRAQRATSSFTIPLDQWTFVAAFYDYNAHKVYLWNNPAQAVDTLNFDQPLLSNDDPLAIGSWYRSDPSTPSITDFEGRIDDVRISGRREDLFPQPMAVTPDDDQTTAVPTAMHVYPNPVFLGGEPGNRIVQFTSSLASVHSIAVYDVLGRTVFRSSNHASSLPFRYAWNLRNTQGQLLQTGIYWVKIANQRNFLIRKFYVIR